MKKLLIIIFLFALVAGIYAELDWKKGVQVDVRPEGGLTVDGTYFSTKEFIEKYPDRVFMNNEFLSKNDFFITGLTVTTNHSIIKYTNKKLMVNAIITTRKGYLIVLLIFAVVCVAVLVYMISRKLKKKGNGT